MPDPPAEPDEEPSRRRATPAGALSLVLPVACVAVPAWVAATRWSSLAAAHPAYALTLAAVALAGIAAGARVLLRPVPRPAGAVRTTARVVVAVLVVAVLGVLLWLRPFPAAPAAVAAGVSDSAVAVLDTPTGIELRPAAANATSGIAFYPGARVDPRAYLALLRPLAEQGHVVVVLRPPFDLAILAGGAAGAAMDARPGVTRWAVGGHSLGGVAAARSAAQGDQRIRGLLLWASYPADDLSDRSDLVVTSVTGERDGLTTPDDVLATRPLLPPDAVVTVVEGAVHAFFGDYGSQPGDGEPTVTRTEAQARIVSDTAQFLATLSAPQPAP